MLKQLKQDVVLVQVLIRLELLELRVDEVAEEEEQLEGDRLLQFLVQVGELYQSPPGPQEIDDLVVLPLLTAIVVPPLIFVLLRMIQKLKYQLPKRILLLNRLLVKVEHTLLVRGLVVREEVHNAIEPVRPHGRILLPIFDADELLQEFVAP